MHTRNRRLTRIFRRCILPLAAVGVAAVVSLGAGPGQERLDEVEAALNPAGINLSGITHWDTNRPFVNLAKNAESFASQGVEVDRLGYPLEVKPGDDAPTVTVFRLGGNSRAVRWESEFLGPYVLTWEGTGDVSIEGMELVSDDTEAAQPKNRKVYNYTEPDEWVKIRLGRSDKSDPVRAIDLRAQRFEGTDGVFHPRFLSNWQGRGLKFYRFMDWGGTNSSEVENWDQRRLPDEFTYAKEPGVPYEHMIDLCNDSQMNMWVCVPHQASDEFVRELARLIHERLDPELKVVVEYSNEVWNWAFDQAQWASAQGHEVGLADERGVESQARWYGQRLGQIWNIFADEFDDDRVLRVLGGHVGNTDWGRMAADQVRQTTELEIDAYAPTSYFKSMDTQNFVLAGLVPHLKNDNRPVDLAAATDLWEQDLLRGEPRSTAKWPYNGRVAEELGVIMVSYEGGEHQNPPHTFTAAENTINDLMRIEEHQDVYRVALELWRKFGGRAHGAFASTRIYDEYGSWGHKEFMAQENAPKYETLVKWADIRGRETKGSVPTVEENDLPEGEAGTEYQARLASAGGDGEITWSVLGGALPEGLTLKSDGQIAGMPLMPGEDKWFMAKAADEDGDYEIGVFHLAIAESPGADEDQQAASDDRAAWLMPGEIEAEAFDFGGKRVAWFTRQETDSPVRVGTDVPGGEDDSASEGTFVGPLEAGDWLEYTVEIPYGFYIPELRVRARGENPAVRLSVDDRLIHEFPLPTGDAWQEVSLETVELARAEPARLRVDVRGGEVELDQVRLAESDFGAEQRPFHGEPVLISNTEVSRVEAEEFDHGGQGVAFFDAEEERSQQHDTGTPPEFRRDLPVEFDERDGGMVLADLKNREWYEYTVDTEPGRYDIVIRYASHRSIYDLRLALDGIELGRVNAPRTDPGGWGAGDAYEHWDELVIEDVTIEAGANRVLRLTSVDGTYRTPWVNWIEFRPR
ncbi:MAG: carbohydrate-binding domain-containing protein [Phycisphaeraceae bacterium]